MDLRGLRIDVDERLAVRMWQPADAPALYERVVANHSYIGEWLPWPSSYASVAVAEAFIEGGAVARLGARWLGRRHLPRRRADRWGWLRAVGGALRRRRDRLLAH